MDKEALGYYFALFNEIGIIGQLSRAVMEAELPDGLLASHFSVLNHLIRVKDGQTPLKLAQALGGNLEAKLVFQLRVPAARLDRLDQIMPILLHEFATRRRPHHAEIDLQDVLDRATILERRGANNGAGGI